MKYEHNKNGISIYLSKNIYSLDAIFKCIYWYGDKWGIQVEDFSDTHHIVNASPISDDFIFDEVKAKVFASKFLNKMNDFQLRDIITKETKNIRDLLVAKAFSNGEFDEEPPGEFEDFLDKTK